MLLHQNTAATTGLTPESPQARAGILEGVTQTAALLPKPDYFVSTNKDHDMGSYLEWWDSLSVLLRVLWLVAVPFTLLFIVQLIALSVRTGTDTREDEPDKPPARFFSYRAAPAFFTAWSWTGISCVEAGLPAVATALLSVSGGVVATFALGRLFNSEHPLGERPLRLTGPGQQTGKVLLRIQARRGSVGKVRIKTPAAFRTLNAVTDDAKDIEVNEAVSVLKVLANNTLLVTRQ